MRILRGFNAALDFADTLRVKLERVVLCPYAEARAEWRKYLSIDVHDDRNVMEKVHREQKRRF